MNKNIINLAIFASGAAIGSAVTYKFLKTKFEQIAKEEIESVKETFSRLQEEKEEDELVGDLDDEEDSKKMSASDYKKKLDELRYSTENEKEGREMGPAPYVISPDEFSERDGFSTLTLYYHSDDILVDEYDKIIENREEIVGEHALESFGEYEDDSVFVRNERRHCDYEILRVEDPYYVEN